MLVKKRYSIREVLLWTRRELLLFFAYAALVTFIYEGLGFHALHVPWTPLALIGTAVAFLIGFQNNAAYGRIWEARKIWGGIVNASRTWAVKVQDMVRSEKENDKGAIKETHLTLVHRHIAWLTALRHSMRQPRSWENVAVQKPDREWKDKVNVQEVRLTLQQELTDHLSTKELEYVLSKDNKATTLLFLQSRHLRKLKEQGLLWEFSFLELERIIEEMFTLQGKSERIKNFPYPRQYATISHLFIWMFLALVPFGIVPEFGEIAKRLNEVVPGSASFMVWAAIPFVAIVSWVFHTMERIGRAGENPFEGSPNDVPISTIARGIEIDLLQQFNASEIPAPLAQTHDVQM